MGVRQTHLYPDIIDLLQKLRNLDLSLYVTTSKYEPMAIRMLKELGIDKYFDNIYGATATRFHKSDLIKDCLIDNTIPLSDALIVGDTKFDIIGSNEVGIKSIGVTWGFGTAEELLLNKADAIISHPFELVNLLNER
ncbi:HAD hydrolase-like protein [Streptococcus iniae]